MLRVGIFLILHCHLGNLLPCLLVGFHVEALTKCLLIEPTVVFGINAVGQLNYVPRTSRFWGWDRFALLGIWGLNCWSVCPKYIEQDLVYLILHDLVPFQK